MGFEAMDLTTRRRLVQMACVAAWSDMDLDASERELVLDMAREVGLEGDDLEMVKRWLRNGPPDFDPYDIPLAHRQTFINAFMRVIAADGRIDAEESEAIQLLRDLSS